MLTPWARDDTDNVRRVAWAEAHDAAADLNLNQDELYEGLLRGLDDFLASEPMNVTVTPAQATVEVDRVTEVTVSVGPAYGFQGVALAIEVTDRNDRALSATSEVFVLRRSREARIEAIVEAEHSSDASRVKYA